MYQYTHAIYHPLIGTDTHSTKTFQNYNEAKKACNDEFEELAMTFRKQRDTDHKAILTVNHINQESWTIEYKTPGYIAIHKGFIL